MNSVRSILLIVSLLAVGAIAYQAQSLAGGKQCGAGAAVASAGEEKPACCANKSGEGAQAKAAAGESKGHCPYLQAGAATRPAESGCSSKARLAAAGSTQPACGAAKKCSKCEVCKCEDCKCDKACAKHAAQAASATRPAGEGGCCAKHRVASADGKTASPANN